jgi:NADH-quinone oxidoreductase subunit C
VSNLETLLSTLAPQFPGAILDKNTQSTPVCLHIQPDRLVDMAQWLWKNKAAYFDMLTCITGIDNGPEVNALEVIYHLYSIPYHQSLALKVTLPRNIEGNQLPEVHSLTGIWGAADWLEREVAEMYGIHFTGHPDLRNLLLPADWEGYPLRKDYQVQEYYRSIKVD